MHSPTCNAALRVMLLLVLQLACSARAHSSEAGTGRIPGEICYDGLGCFRNDGHFFDFQTRPLSVLPQSPQSIRTKFFVYTPSNKDRATEIQFGDADSVRRSGFDARKETKIIVHGFRDSTGSGWMGRMKDGLLRIGSYNVILLDWSGGNSFPYTQATANTRVVGAQLGQLINWLQSPAFGGSAGRFHLIGHSLGAHISGYAGTALGGSLGRITGMDPAGPFFEFTHPDVRLDHTDARFVDAIHTDGSSVISIILLQGGFGMMQPVGHVDFYPNGGKLQTGCDSSFNNVRTSIEPSGSGLSCNHLAVLDFVIASIENQNKQYKAIPCDSYNNYKAKRCSCGSVGCASMGINADSWRPNGRQNVKMYLDTSASAPFEVPQ